MKSIKILAICLFLGIGISNAQQKNVVKEDPATQAKSMVEKLTKELGLTRPQQDSIFNYITQQDKKGATTKKGDKHATLQQDRAKRNEKIKSFLTTEQKAKYDALNKKPDPKASIPTKK